MEQNHDYEKACERYLLGELSEQEQAQLEEAYFANDARFESFLDVKLDLIDAYARGDLTGAKREQFEQHFLASAPRRQLVEEAKEFIRAVSAASLNESRVSATLNASTRSAEVPWWRSISNYFTVRPLVFKGAVAALVLLVLAGSWMLVRNFQRQRADREELEQAALRQKEEELRRATVPPGNENSTGLANNEATNLNAGKPPADSSKVPQPGTVNNGSRPPSSGHVASIFLTPFSSRSDSSSSSLLLLPETRAVRLQLGFKGDDYGRYKVVLRTAEGEVVFQSGALKARTNATGKSVTLTLDPSILRRQDYVVTLNGITSEGKPEIIADYYFRAKRRSAQSTPAIPRQ